MLETVERDHKTALKAKTEDTAALDSFRKDVLESVNCLRSSLAEERCSHSTGDQNLAGDSPCMESITLRMQLEFQEKKETYRREMESLRSSLAIAEERAAYGEFAEALRREVAELRSCLSPAGAAAKEIPAGEAEQNLKEEVREMAAKLGQAHAEIAELRKEVSSLRSTPSTLSSSRGSLKGVKRTTKKQASGGASLFDLAAEADFDLDKSIKLGPMEPIIDDAEDEEAETNEKVTSPVANGAQGRKDIPEFCSTSTWDVSFKGGQKLGFADCKEGSGKVTKVVPGSQADAAGVQVGWEIVSINGGSHSTAQIKEVAQNGGTIRFKLPQALPAF